jgi:hypothetical protein
VFSSNGNFTGTVTTGAIVVDGGTVAAPGISFSGDSNTGIFSNQADHVYITTGGTARAYFNSSGLVCTNNVYTGDNSSFRNYGGVWTASTGETGNGFVFANSIDGTAMTISSTGTVEATSDFRAPIFYDTDNTVHYSNPAGTSNLNHVHIGYSGSFADGVDPDISTANLLVSTRLFTPKIALIQDATGDDAYITADDNNNAYSVCGQAMAAWFEFFGDKASSTAPNSAGLVASGVYSSFIEAKDNIRVPIIYDRSDTSYYLNPDNTSNVKTITAQTINVTNLNAADNFGKLYTFTESITLTTDWQDTSISGGDLPTGTYIVQVLAYDYDVGGGQYQEYYSGTMSWLATGTNDIAAQEIPLHNAGHADNDRAIFLRTKRNLNPGFLTLQIAGRTNNTGADNYIFKFRRMI